MRTGADGATSFQNKEIANKAIKDVFNKNVNLISEWLDNSNDKRISIITEHDFVVGYGVKADNNEHVNNIKKTKILLEKNDTIDLGFLIVTFYPKLK